MSFKSRESETMIGLCDHALASNVRTANGRRCRAIQLASDRCLHPWSMTRAEVVRISFRTSEYDSATLYAERQR
jgi:hypothetical protein